MKKLLTMENVRVAFNYKTWHPTQEEWVFVARCIQPKEKLRVGEYVFKKDAKASMSGRLLIRKVLSSVLKVPYQNLQLARTKKGKPFLTNPLPEHLANFSFNISHSGDYAVLAAEPNKQVGVDVMKVEPPPGKTIDEFFFNMRRQFTDSEWSMIGAGYKDEGKLRRFYRHWCLKESFVKALGVGIGFSLQRLCFQIHTKELQPGAVVTDTSVLVDNIPDPSWRFEESLLGEDHVVVVALKDNLHHQRDFCDQSISVIDYMPVNSSMVPELCWTGPVGVRFSPVQFDQLVDGAIPQSEPDLNFWQAFDRKMEHPPRRKLQALS